MTQNQFRGIAIGLAVVMIGAVVFKSTPSRMESKITVEEPQKTYNVNWLVKRHTQILAINSRIDKASMDFIQYDEEISQLAKRSYWNESQRLTWNHLGNSLLALQRDRELMVGEYNDVIKEFALDTLDIPPQHPPVYIPMATRIR
jgi:hypothetical protein